MKKVCLILANFSISTIILLSFLLGCATSQQSLVEKQMAKRLAEINLRLGTTREDLRDELSNSAGYSRDQALELKRRIGELVVAYEELAVEANCAERHYPTCQDLFTAGLRYNSTILDAEYPNLPPLPPIVAGYRLHGSPVDYPSE